MHRTYIKDDRVFFYIPEYQTLSTPMVDSLSVCAITQETQNAIIQNNISPFNIQQNSSYKKHPKVAHFLAPLSKATSSRKCPFQALNTRKVFTVGNSGQLFPLIVAAEMNCLHPVT